MHMCVLSCFSCVWLCATPQTAAHQASPSLGFSRQNTGVGCHFLLQCMKVKSQSEVAQLCPTLSDPVDCSPPGSSVHGIFHARVLEWGVIGQIIGVSASTSVLPMNTQDWSALRWTGWISLQSKDCKTVSKDSQESSPTPQFKNISSSALSFLHSPTLTSIHDHRKNHSLD